jgi:excisionase family DNA binding protein
MKKIFGLLVISLWLNGCKQSDPEDVLGREGDVVNFSGYVWDVKINEYAVGPGPNYFSGFYEDVFVDDNGYLHMRIAEHNGKWYSSEIVGRDTLGYGKYTWVMQADLENIPENITVGLFTWDNESFFAEANSEVDIEFSKWGNPDLATTLHYSVQPVAPMNNESRMDPPRAPRKRALLDHPADPPTPPSPSAAPLQPPTLPDFLTVPDVARLLQLSTKTVYTLARAGALPGCVRLGNTIRFHREQLLDGLARQALAGPGGTTRRAAPGRSRRARNSS